MHARTMPRRWPTVAGITAYAAFAVLRLWQFHGRGVGVWPDTTGYQETAACGLVLAPSSGRAGARRACRSS